VEETATLVIPAHATIDQGFVFSQEERTLSGNSSDVNRLHSPAVSTTVYCEDRDECELTGSLLNSRGNKVTPSRNIRQQQMSYLSVQGTVFHQSSSPVSPVPVKRRQPQSGQEDLQAPKVLELHTLVHSYLR
jgi:hypothetical protein